MANVTGGYISQPIEFPGTNFGVLYADPPWRYEHSKTDSREIEEPVPNDGP
ncbi:MAG: hypothetical protein ACREXR_09195 [Gammaproteobacteria bacterium]